MRWLATVALTYSACAGSIEQRSGDDVVDTTDEESLMPGGGAGGAAVVGHGGSAPTEPGRVVLHRLTSTQYNNTVADLLGTALRPGDFFQAAGVAGFDNNAHALSGVSAVQVRAYWDAARDLARDAFAREASRKALVTCQPKSTGDTTCAREIIAAFGLRAWRRPLDADELATLGESYGRATVDLGKSHEGALEHVVRIMLASPSFYYRVERESATDATSSRALDGFELASRLSYALWSTMPDAALFETARDGRLQEGAELERETERLLQSPKATAFLDGFLAQWLHLNTLAGHRVDAKLFPMWSEGLKTAIVDEARSFFRRLLEPNRRYSDIVSSPLAATAGTAALYENDVDGARAGFLGLPAYLTVSSTPKRTAPTVRGKIVLDSLLCTELPVPDDLEIAPLEQAGGGSDPDNIRKKLEQHRASPDCAACHAVLDPIGLALEGFDPIGRHRTRYADGTAIDTSGVFEEQAFSGPATLRALLEKDERLLPCAAHKLFTYVLGRNPTDADEAHVTGIALAWKGGSLRELVKATVLSDAFRRRSRAETL